MSDENGTPHPPEDNPANGQVNVGALVQPRPLPTAWDLKVIPFGLPNGETKQFVELRLYTPTGVHVTYWDPVGGKRLAADIRGAAAQAAQAQSGIVIAHQLPPTTPR